MAPALPEAVRHGQGWGAPALGLSAGLHTITATAFGTDALGGGSVTDTHTIRINAPPNCATVSPSLAQLWPPNGKMVPITLSGATDPEGGAVTVTVTGVTQDEVVAGPGNQRSPDAAVGATSNSVALRAERFGGQDGRVYRIAFTGNDPLGGSCSGAVNVSVPHDRMAHPPSTRDSPTTSSDWRRFWRSAEPRSATTRHPAPGAAARLPVVATEDVDRYLAALEEPKRSTLEALRTSILEVVREAEQGMSYGMPAFKLGGKTVAGFAAFRRHLSYLPHSGSVLSALLGDTCAATRCRRGR